MNWTSWSDFVHMGGYALYVWGSYAMAAGLVAAEIVALKLRRRDALARIGTQDGQ